MLETVEATAEVFTNHTADKNNPHNVTKEQVGLSNVDNTADMDKPVSNAVSSAINSFKEENSREHSEIHSAINTLKEESSSEIEKAKEEINKSIDNFYNRLNSAVNTLKDSNSAAHTALQQEINNTKSELQSAMKTKSDIGHNHDSVYIKAEQAASAYATKEELSSGLNSKANTSHSHTEYAAKSHTHSNYSPTNHTHTGYSASNHNHDSVYSKLNHTHTGIATDKLSIKNLFMMLGITANVTTQQFIDKIVAKVMTLQGMYLSGWLFQTEGIHLTDMPADIIQLTVTIIDANGIYLEARAPFGNNSLWIGSVNGGKFGGWKQVLNSTGQARALEITGTEADATWTHCGNVGLTAHYANPENTGNGNGGAELSEPVLMLSLGSPYSDRKVQLAIGTDTNSLYVRTARTEGSGGKYWLYGEWRKI